MRKMDKEEKTREKKKQILEVLKTLLENHVYSTITVEDVAREAGYSKGGILHYFPSKEDMYLELIRDLFLEIELEHARVIKDNFSSREKAGLSALYSVERFILDKKTTKVLLNIIMYGYEDEKIMGPVREFIRSHFLMYKGLIEETRALKAHTEAEYSPEFIARIAQTIVFSIGMLESIDPTSLDTIKMIRYIVSLLKV
ncbi:MAG: TetR/AcrR family transcriptional regulator [Spirochaetes bacterium]|nr:MAG: TetR/AcrR family transcriptional regulator [Spirochaetota bacterium]